MTGDAADGGEVNRLRNTIVESGALAVVLVLVAVASVATTSPEPTADISWFGLVLVVGLGAFTLNVIRREVFR